MKPNPIIRLVIDALCDCYASSDEGNMAVVDLAVLVAMADGAIDQAEMASVTASLEALVGSRLGPAVIQHLVGESCAKIEAIGADARARAIGESLAAHQAVDEGLRLGLAIALASEGLSAVERERLAMVATAGGVEPARLETLAEAVREQAEEEDPDKEA